MNVRRVVAGVLVAVLMSSGAWAADFRGSIDRVAAAAAKQDRGGFSSIPPVYKWTGLALIGVGTADMILGAAFTGDGPGSYRACPLWDTGCSSSTGVIVQGAVIAGAGAALLFVGMAKANRGSASITPTRGGFMVQKKIRF